MATNTEYAPDSQVLANQAKARSLGITIPGLSKKSSSPVNSNYRTLIDPNSGTNNTINDALSSFFESQGNLGSQEKTIMETFASRAGLAKQGGVAERKLTESNYAEQIASQLDENSRNYINASEGRAGFATQTAAVKFLEESGSKRIRTLEKDRDSLLLQSKVLEAQRLDSLISEEQTAITNARKSWVENLLNISNEQRAQSAETRAISAENRAIEGFETPEEKRQRDLIVDTTKTIQNLATTAPDAGILATDDFDTAVTKYRNSLTYKNNERLGELAIKQAEAELENTQASTQKIRLGDKTTTNLAGTPIAGPGITPEQSQAINFAFDNVMSEYGRGSSVDQAKNVRATFNSYIEAGNYDQAKVYLQSLVKAGLKEEQRNQVSAREQAVASLTRLQALLDDYNASGGDTGVLKGTLETIANKVGKTNDPALRSIGTEIQAAVQNYRRAISGASFTEQESKEYDKIFPSSFWSSYELNNAKIEGALNSLVNNNNAFYRGTLGADNYNIIFGDASNVTGATGRTSFSLPSLQNTGNQGLTTNRSLNTGNAASTPSSNMFSGSGL